MNHSRLAASELKGSMADDCILKFDNQLSRSVQVQFPRNAKRSRSISSSNNLILQLTWVLLFYCLHFGVVMIYHALYDISLGQYIDGAMYRKNETLQKMPQISPIYCSNVSIKRAICRRRYFGRKKRNMRRWSFATLLRSAVNNDDNTLIVVLILKNQEFSDQLHKSI